MTKNDLTNGDERSHLIRLAVPIIWGILSIVSVNLVDTYFVSQLGTDPLAAMGFTFPVIMVMTSMAMGVGVGTASVVARAIGGGETEWVRSYTTQSIFIAVAIALAFAVTGLLTVEPLFRLLGAPAALLPLIHDYMDTWYLGSFLVVVPMVGNAAIRAAGNSKLPSLVMISVALTNLVLDPLLIFGLLGFPRLELRGAALATIFAYSVAFAVGLYVLKAKLNFLSLAACHSHVWESWRAILRISVPAVGTNLIAPLSIAVTTWMVAHYGSAAVAGFSVASRIETLSMLVLMALSSVMGPFAGQNWGAGKRDRLHRAIGLSHRFAWFWGIGIAVLLWPAAEPIVGLFTADALALRTATSYLLIVPVTFAFMGIVMLTASVANGIGDPLPALLMTLLRLAVLYFPLAWLLSRWLGLNGIYLAIALSNALVGLAAIRWTRHKCPKTP